MLRSHDQLHEKCGQTKTSSFCRIQRQTDTNTSHQRLSIDRAVYVSPKSFATSYIINIPAQYTNDDPILTAEELQTIRHHILPQYHFIAFASYIHLETSNIEQSQYYTVQSSRRCVNTLHTNGCSLLFQTGSHTLRIVI